MSLGLFNCRLIQPAGDQLFFFSAVLPLPVPVRASSVQSPCDPSCSAPTNGRAQNASCLSFPERFCFGFQRGEVPSGAEGFTPTDSPANFPEDPPILPTDSAIEPYFDNVGGDTLDAALSALRVHGRIIACGGISSYNEAKPRPGPSNLFNIPTKRLTMKGLIVSDWLDRQAEFEKEVGGYFEAGKLKNRETVAKGIDRAVDAFIGLFQGRNIGK